MEEDLPVISHSEEHSLELRIDNVPVSQVKEAAKRVMEAKNNFLRHNKELKEKLGWIKYHSSLKNGLEYYVRLGLLEGSDVHPLFDLKDDIRTGLDYIIRNNEGDYLQKVISECIKNLTIGSVFFGMGYLFSYAPPSPLQIAGYMMMGLGLLIGVYTSNEEGSPTRPFGSLWNYFPRASAAKRLTKNYAELQKRCMKLYQKINDGLLPENMPFHRLKQFNSLEDSAVRALESTKTDLLGLSQLLDTAPIYLEDQKQLLEEPKKLVP